MSVVFPPRWLRLIPLLNSPWSPWMAAPEQLNWDLLTALKRGRIRMFDVLYIGVVHKFVYNILLLFPQWALHHDGQMGRTGEVERALGESSPEHVNSLTLRCCDRCLYNGKNWRVRVHGHSACSLVSIWHSRKMCWRQRSGWIIRWSLSFPDTHLFKVYFAVIWM